MKNEVLEDQEEGEESSEGREQRKWREGEGMGSGSKQIRKTNDQRGVKGKRRKGRGRRVRRKGDAPATFPPPPCPPQIRGGSVEGRTPPVQKRQIA